MLNQSFSIFFINEFEVERLIGLHCSPILREGCLFLDNIYIEEVVEVRCHLVLSSLGITAFFQPHTKDTDLNMHQ